MDDSGADGGRAFGEALKVNQSVKHLNLSCKYLGAEGGRSIGEALKVNESVKHLNLSSNGLGADGAHAIIGEALKVNQTVTRLYLNNNNLGSDGARAIGEALKLNQTMTHLDLSYNNFGDGARAIGEARKANQSVTHLYLNYNNLAVDDARAIEKDLVFCSSLIECTGVSHQVEELCKRNQHLHGRVQMSVVALLCIRWARRTILNEAPKDVVAIIGACLWKTRTMLRVGKNKR